MLIKLTGGKVYDPANKVSGEVRDTYVEDGKIIDHRDEFDLWKWSAQALGLPGKLLGWSPMVKSRIRSTTRSNLDAFRAAHS